MVGFSHRKILNSKNTDKEWVMLKKTVSKEIAYKATEVTKKCNLLKFYSYKNSRKPKKLNYEALRGTTDQNESEKIIRAMPSLLST